MKIQLDATVRSLIYFTAKSLYVFRVSTAPIMRSIKNFTAAYVTGHNIGTATATSLQVGTWPRWREVAVAVPILWPVT